MSTRSLGSLSRRGTGERLTHCDSSTGAGGASLSKRWALVSQDTSVTVCTKDMVIASLVAQLVKSLSAMRKTQVPSWVGKIPWRRKWYPTPVFLPGEFHGQRSLVGYSPWGHEHTHGATTEWLTDSSNPAQRRATSISVAPLHTHLGKGKPLSVLRYLKWPNTPSTCWTSDWPLRFFLEDNAFFSIIFYF